MGEIRRQAGHTSVFYSFCVEGTKPMSWETQLQKALPLYFWCSLQLARTLTSKPKWAREQAVMESASSHGISRQSWNQQAVMGSALAEDKNILGYQEPRCYMNECLLCNLDVFPKSNRKAREIKRRTGHLQQHRNLFLSCSINCIKGEFSHL